MAMTSNGASSYSLIEDNLRLSGSKSPGELAGQHIWHPLWWNFIMASIDTAQALTETGDSGMNLTAVKLLRHYVEPCFHVNE